jgi:hypothetical protein
LQLMGYAATSLDLSIGNSDPNGESSAKFRVAGNSLKTA